MNIKRKIEKLLGGEYKLAVKDGMKVGDCTIGMLEEMLISSNVSIKILDSSATGMINGARKCSCSTSLLRIISESCA